MVENDLGEFGTQIAYDCELKRPGCVLLQAAMGCNPNVANYFPSETWLIAPTPELKVYSITNEILQKLIAITKATHNAV